MVELFQAHKFRSSVSTRQTYDSDTAFNETNITNYLAELEEYIAFLVTVVAAEKEDPNAAISMIDIENLTAGPMSKEFKRSSKEKEIDPPVTVERVQ